MKRVKILINSLVGLVFCSFVATAQEEVLQLNFEGICHVTNSSGQLVKQTVNNRSILRQFANHNGITNLNSIALVYHVKGDERGDVIEIVRVRTGEVLSEVFGLFFPTDLPNGDGSVFFEHSYIYNSQQSISIGAAQVRHKFGTDNNGNPNHTINGQLLYYMLPDGTRGLRICSANISASKPFVPKVPPVTTTSTKTTASPPVASQVPLRKTLLAQNL